MDPLRIAIIDDDQLILKLAEVELRAVGFEVLCIPDSSTAVEQLLTFSPQLIFLDIMMPKVDGFTLCKRLRDIEALEESKIVFISARKFNSDKRIARNVGADGFFEKPFKPDAFVKKANDILRQKALIQFWGTRGSIAAPSSDTVRYGGNTSCVELLLPYSDDLFILDAGTGLRQLGDAKLREREHWNGHIFITHTHWDHIQGLPFFMPWYKAGNSFTIISADQHDVPLEQVIAGQMQAAYFPVDFSCLGADIEFKKVAEGDYTINRLRVETLLANHPNVTLMFKFHLDDKTVVYATDNELERLGADGVDPMSGNRERMIEFFRGADLLIHDAQYTPAEYEIKRGWGHSAWNEALDIAVRSEVKSLVLFHHDPDHSDDVIDHILAQCREELDRQGITLPVSAAKEGEQIIIESIGSDDQR